MTQSKSLQPSGHLLPRCCEDARTTCWGPRHPLQTVALGIRRAAGTAPWVQGPKNSCGHPFCVTSGGQLPKNHGLPEAKRPRKPLWVLAPCAEVPAFSHSRPPACLVMLPRPAPEPGYASSWPALTTHEHSTNSRQGSAPLCHQAGRDIQTGSHLELQQSRQEGVHTPAGLECLRETELRGSNNQTETSEARRGWPAAMQLSPPGPGPGPEQPGLRRRGCSGEIPPETGRKAEEQEGPPQLLSPPAP